NDNLVPAPNMDFPSHDLQSQRLEQAGSDALPRKTFRRAIDTADQPDVAIPGADGRSVAVREEIEAGEAHPAVPGIVVRMGENIDREGTIVPSKFAPR